MCRFEVGQGISWTPREEGFDLYGIVLDSDRHGLLVLEVLPLGPYDKCYDDLDADRRIHADNVRLFDCPPPFSKIVEETMRRCGYDRKGYVVATVDDPIELSIDDVNMLNVRIIDGGEKVSERLMHEIYHHPWPTQLEREKAVSKANDRAGMAEAAFGLDGIDEGMDRGFGFPT